jgi:hypothetical protein
MVIPTLASTPTNENTPAVASEDQQFMGLTTLSEEELMGIDGNSLIINDAYYHLTTTIGPKYEGDY